MKETEKRIKEYKELLPHAREKVFAALLIFIISAVVMVSTTFAWLVLSRSPEVSGITTNISANGNLEIALSGPEGEQPPESMVGDSVKDILLRNLTWGNIINLADPSYGLGNIELRPASLNEENLLDKPLFGATYSKDGRVEKLNKDFAYSNYDIDNDLFVVSPASSPKYGVRAISSVKTTNIGGDKIYQAMLQLADDKNTEAGQKYLDIVGTKEYLDALVGVIGRYAQTKVGDSNPDCTEYVGTIYQMCLDFQKVFEESGEALLLLAQAQQFKATNDQYGTLTLNELCTLSAAELRKRGVNLSSLATYKTDRNTLNSCVSTFETLAEKSSSQTIYWNDIRVAMNQLVDINSTTLQVKGSSDAPIPVGSLSAGNATKFSGKTSYAEIQKGLIRNFEKRTGALMKTLDESKRTASASVSAKVGVFSQTVTITAIVSTNAAVPYDFGKDYNEALNNDSEFAGGDRVAQDTYGLAVDFWLRTNAASTYIKLEGATLTSKKEEQEKDFHGNEIWTATATIDGEEVIHDLIKDGDKWLLADGGEDVTETIAEYNITPVKKMTVTETVIGYEGENRVWQDLNLSPNATTQGSGSCYVFYADTPQDQAQSLKLLGSMKVAFIDQDGVKLATAKMDTEHFYADSGRVTVPLVLDETDSVLVGTDIEGKPIRSITQINKRSPIRITALVYLSGSSLTNDMVLSSSNIEGQLNIQFGSTEQLSPINDERLEDDTVSVTATADKTFFDYKTEAANMVANVDVTVEGFEPETVEAFFVRKINATQGTRQETMVFTKNDLSRAAIENGSTWHASQKFTMPGIYVLRNVRIDGVDHPVKDAVTVEIPGFDVQSLTCRDTYLFTSEKRASTALTLRFSASDDKLLPKKSVQGVFINENNVSTTVNFKKNTATHDYTGTADFVTSGMYRLQYLVLDGETYELPEAMWKNVEVYIGLSAIVDLDRTNPENAITEFEYNKEIKDQGGKTVALMVKIVDDSGNEITGMTGTRLYYKMSGSIKTLAEDLVWDSDLQAYKGNFIVRGAGIYSFKNLTVGSNNITYASRSFIIKATSPEPPAYHSAEETLSYQFAPNENAEFKLKITNSEAIDAKAVIVNVNDPTKSETVDGTIVDASTVDLGNGTVSSWRFLIPGAGMDDSITQDGEWQVKAIHLSGFTFENENGNQVSYTGESPMVIDLSANNIVTKVVCTYNIKVTGGDQTFTGDFMDKHSVVGDRATIVIEDYEHEPIPGVGNVQLVYNLASYSGYTTKAYTENPNLTKKTVKCTASGDGKTFVADAFELQYAGEYQAELYFDIGTNKYTTNQDEPANFYKFTVNGIPKYTVKWNAPTVTITGTNPAGATASNPNGGTAFDKNLGTGTNTNLVKVKNYYEDYYAIIYEKYATLSYSLSTITLRLDNAGSALSSSNTATVTLKNQNYKDKDNVITFTANGTSKTSNVGAMDGRTRNLLGKAIVKTIDMNYGGQVYTLNLSHELEINGPGSVLPSPTLVFNIPAEYKWLVSDLNLTDVPSNPSCRPVSFTAPATITKNGTDTTQVGEVQLVGYKVETTTQPIKWTTSESSGCGGSTNKDHTGSKVTTVRTPVYQGTFANVERTFTIAKWEISGSSTGTINAGATRNFTSGDNVIKPVVTYVDGATGEPYDSTEYGESEAGTVTWMEGNSKLDNAPSGWSNNGNATIATTYTDVSGNNISKPAGWPED